MPERPAGFVDDPHSAELRAGAVSSRPAGASPGEGPAGQFPSEAFSHGILDSIVVGVLQFDAEGRAIYANAYARRLLAGTGISETGLKLTDFRPYTFWPDGSPCREEDYPARKCFETGEPQGPATIGVRYGQGETLWATISVVPVLDPKTGKPQSVIATFVDDSHPMHVAESLRQSEDRYRRLVEGAPDTILVHQSSKIVYINDAGVRMWGGTSPDQFIGRDILDFVHPRYHDVVKRRVRQVRSGISVPLMDQLHVRLDGSRIRVEVKGMPCMYNGKPSVQAILRDVTRRRRVERQVRRHREILRKFFDHIPLLVAMFDRDGRMKMVNRQWRRMLGWEGELTLTELIKRCYPLEKDQRDAAEFMRTAPPGWRDTRIRGRDGKPLHLSCAVIALSDGARIGIAQDITERKRAESILRKHKIQLERRVDARTEQLVRKNRQLQDEIAVRLRAEAQLQEKQQTLQQMLDTHERHRQLLAYEIHDTFVQDVIGSLMFLDAFHDRLADESDQDLQPLEQARELLQRSVAGARRMISLLRPPIIDEQGVVAAIEYLVSELNTRGMDIRLDHDVRIERMPGIVEAAVFRIVQEALTNVQRHSGSQFAEVKLSQDGDRLHLEIRDFGSGFDPQHVESGHFGLQGIGERAKLIGGTVAITSAPGEGTEIVVDIPLPKNDADLVDPADPNSAE